MPVDIRSEGHGVSDPEQVALRDARPDAYGRAISKIPVTTPAEAISRVRP